MLEEVCAKQIISRMRARMRNTLRWYRDHRARGDSSFVVKMSIFARSTGCLTEDTRSNNLFS